MSDVINDYFQNIQFENSWFPSQNFLESIFSTAATQICGSDGYYREENTPLYPLLLSENLFFWVWNSSPNKRHDILKKIISLYNTKRSYYNSKDLLSSEQRADVINIATACFDALPEDSELRVVQDLRVSLSQLPIDRKIDYTKKYMESSLSSNGTLSSYWRGVGLDNSKDPVFYATVWAKQERCQGYTDVRSMIIEAASKCEDFPEQIISDLVSGGHIKNKLSLIRVFIGKIDAIKSFEARNKISVPSPKIDQYRSVLARFSSIEDYSVQKAILPYLSKESLVFAAPIASKLGLGGLLDRVMRGESEDPRGYRYY